MKFVLIVVWFAFPQQQQTPDFSSVAWRQPLGVAMQEFDDRDACETQARYLASQYIRARCSPKSSVTTEPLNSDEMPTVR